MTPQKEIKDYEHDNYKTEIYSSENKAMLITEENLLTETMINTAMMEELSP